MAINSSEKIELAPLGQLLESWLRSGDRNLVDPVVKGLTHASASSGYSNETLICSVEHGEATQRHAESLVVRLPPAGEGLFENYDMASQYNLMDRLRRRGNFSTPSCLWLETDTSVLGRPFYVMELVDGLVPSDTPPYHTSGWVADASHSERERLWWSSVKSLAELSDVDWKAVGLEFLDWPDRNRSRTEQQIDMCDGMRVRGGADLPDIDIPVVREAGRWLRSHLPRNEEAGIVWGDARLGNMMYREFEPIAHLDWEWAMIGDPLNDLSYFLLMDLFFRLVGHPSPVPQLSGFASEMETVERYAQLTGRSVRNYNYFWVLNAYKIYSLAPRFASLHVRLGLMTVEEASLYRTFPALAATILSRLS